MKKEWLWFIAACLFGVLIFFATDKLVESPPTWFDEGIYLQAAMNDSLHGAQVLQLAPNTYVSTAFVTGGFPFLKPISWSFDIFGIGLLQARLVMVGFIIGSVLIFFLLVRQLFGMTTALASLALLVTFPPLYGQGKNVLGEVPGIFFLGTFLYALYEITRHKFEGIRWYLLAGVSAGLCVATKPIFFLLGGAVIITALIYRRSIEFKWNYLLLSCAVFCIPFAFWFTHQFTHTDSATAVLGYYANPYGITELNAQILTNVLRFFHETSAVYFMLIVALWLTAVAVRLYTKEKISIVEATIVSFVVLVILAYLRTAGWYRYFFVAEIPALVFLPYAIESIARRITKRSLMVMWCIVVVLVGLHTHQLLSGSWVAEHSARTTTRDIQIYMRTLPKDKTYFVYNTPAAVLFLPSQNYYQYLVPNPLIELGHEELTALAEGKADYVLTNSKSWQEASSSFTQYIELKIIDDFVIASRK